MPKKGNNGPVAADELRLLFERVERLVEEKKALQDDIKDVFNEAKSRGFDVPTMKNVLKLRKMEPDQRRNTRAMIELYLAAIGMGDGSLSDLAVEFLQERRGEAPEEPETGVDQTPPAPRVSGLGGAEGEDLPEGAPPPPPLTIDDARRMGRDAATAGKPVTGNPFPARDPRRAAWDEEWCRTAGSDGMEIPDFLRPPPKPGEAPKKGGGE